MVETIDEHNRGFNNLFFVKLLNTVRRFWWIAAISSVTIFISIYLLQSNIHRYESTATIYRWYDLNSGRIINDRVAETLLNALAASNPSISDDVDFIRVQSIKGTDFLRVSALASTPEKAAEVLRQSLAQLPGGEVATSSVSNALNESKADYGRMLRDLDRSLGLLELRMTSAAADVSDPEGAWVDETMRELLSPVEQDVLNLRNRIQDVLHNVDEVGDRRYGFDSENILLAPTTPSAPVPSNAFVIAILAAIAAFLVASALAIALAAAMALSVQDRRRD